MTERRIKGRGGYALRQVAPGVRRWVSTAQRPAVQASPVDPADPRIQTLADLQQQIPRLRATQGQTPLFTEALENTLGYATRRAAGIARGMETSNLYTQAMAGHVPQTWRGQGVPSPLVSNDRGHPLHEQVRDTMNRVAIYPPGDDEREEAVIQLRDLSREAAILRTAQGVNPNIANTVRALDLKRQMSSNTLRGLRPELRDQFDAQMLRTGLVLRHKDHNTEIHLRRPERLTDAEDFFEDDLKHPDRLHVEDWIIHHLLGKVTPTELRERMMQEKSLPSGFWGDNPLLKVEATRLGIEFHINPDDLSRPRVYREFDPSSGEMHHTAFMIPADKRKGGAGGKIIRSQLDLWRELGVEKVTLDAAMDGPMVWPRFGFVNNVKASRHDLGTNIARNLITRDAPMDLLRANPFRYGLDPDDEPDLQTVREHVAEVLATSMRDRSLKDVLSFADQPGMARDLVTGDTPFLRLLLATNPRPGDDEYHRDIEDDPEHFARGRYDVAMRDAWTMSRKHHHYELDLTGRQAESNWRD